MYFRSVSTYFVFNVISALLPILTLPIFTKYLSPYDYGVLALFNIVNMLAGNFFRMELNSALKRQYVENRETFPQYLGTAFAFSNFVLTFYAVILVLCLPWLGNFQGLTTSWFFLILMLSYLRFHTVSLHHLLQLTNRAFLYGVWGLSATLVTFGLALALMVWYGFDWQARAWAEVAVAVGAFPIAVYFLKRDFSLKWQFDVGILKTMLRFSLPLLVSSMIGYVLIASDRLFIAKMIGPQELGLYAVAVQLSSVIGLFFGSLYPAWESWLYKTPGGITSKNIGGIITRFTAIAAVSIIVMMVLPPVLGWVLPYLVDKNFSAAAAYICPTMLAACSAGLFGLLMPILVVMRRTMTVVKIHAALLVVSGPLIFLFVMQWGAVGAAYAMSIAYVAGCFLILNCALKFLKNKVTIS